MVRRSAPLAAVAAALALASCGEDDESSADGPVSFAPVEAPLYLEASRASDEQVDNAEALIDELGEVPLLGSTIDPRDLIEQAIDEAAADAGVEFTFAEDIEPWLGDRVGLALLSLDDLVSEAEADSAVDEAQPDFVAALEVSDEAAAEDSVDGLIAADDQIEVSETEIGGVTVTRPEGEEGGVAVTDGFLVFGGTDDALEQAFAARDEDSLGDSDEFAEALDGLPSERLGAAYLDLGGILEAAVEEGEIDPVELEAIRGLYGDGFDRPLAFALSAGERTLALDVAGAAAITASPPRLGATELIGEAPADAFAAIGALAVGEQARDFVDFVAANADLFGGGALTPEEISQGLETAVGVSFDTVAAAAGDAAVHVRGELPDRFVIGAQLALAEGGLPTQVYDFVGEELRSERFRLGAPLGGSGNGFSAENPSAAPGALGFVNVEVETDAVFVTLAPSRSVAEDAPPSGDSLGGDEGFTAATDALGEEYGLAAYADLGPILDAALGDSSLLDVATGGASAEDAIAAFIADKLGFVAIGIHAEEDQIVQRLLVGLD